MEPFVCPEVRVLAEAVRRVAAMSSVEVPGAQALDELRVLMAASDQLKVALLERLGDVEHRQLYALDAHGSTATWVEAEKTSVDRGDVALAKRLGRLPSVQEALSAGRLSIATAQRVQRAVEKVRGFLDQRNGLIDGQPAQAVLDNVIVNGVCLQYGEALGGLDETDPRLLALLDQVRQIAASPVSEVARVEAAFVALGTRLQGRLLSQLLDVLIDALLPLQLEDKTEQAHRDRGLVLAPFEDRPGGRLEADLDAEAYELLWTALAAAAATDPDNVSDTELAAQRRAAGEEPFLRGPGLRPRSRLGQRHDALRRILSDWLGSAIAGSRGKAVPHIGVAIPLGGLDRQPGTLPARGSSSQSLAAGLVRRWLCDSTITRFVMGLGNRVIEVSHTERTLKAHERRAKLVETGGRCQVDGCVHPPGIPLVPHHVTAWAKNHTTSLEDTVLLSEDCHHDVHEGGLTLRLRDGRLLSADGWVPQIHAA